MWKKNTDSERIRANCKKKQIRRFSSITERPGPGPCGPFWAHMGTYGPIALALGRINHVTFSYISCNVCKTLLRFLYEWCEAIAQHTTVLKGTIWRLPQGDNREIVFRMTLEFLKGIIGRLFPDPTEIVFRTIVYSSEIWNLCDNHFSERI